LIESLGGEAIAVQTDVSSAKQVRQMIHTTINHFGRLDFACNAAGIGRKLAPTADVSEEDFDSMLAINLT